MLQLIRLVTALAALAIFSLWSASFALSPENAEAPPFRAWWPIVNVEIEAGGRGFHAIDGDADKDGESKQRYGFGAGVTDWLFFEFEGEYEKKPGGSLVFAAYEIESRIELTETMKNPTPSMSVYFLVFQCRMTGLMRMRWSLDYCYINVLGRGEGPEILSSSKSLEIPVLIHLRLRTQYNSAIV